MRKNEVRISDSDFEKLRKRIAKISFMNQEAGKFAPIKHRGKNIHYQFTFKNHKDAKDYANFMRYAAASSARIKRGRKNNKEVYRLYYD